MFMKIVFSVLLILYSSAAVCQSKNEIMASIQNAKDSMALNKFAGAIRVLDSLHTFGLYADSIKAVKDEVMSRSISLSFEKYKERAFDESVKYY